MFTGPEANEGEPAIPLSPDAPFKEDVFRVTVGPSRHFPFALAVNDVLAKAGRRERWRVISYAGMEDVYYAEGIWSPEGAKDLINQRRSPMINNVYSLDQTHYVGPSEEVDRIYSFRVEPEVLDILVRSGILRKRKDYAMQFDVKVPRSYRSTDQIRVYAISELVVNKVRFGIEVIKK